MYLVSLVYNIKNDNKRLPYYYICSYKYWHIDNILIFNLCIKKQTDICSIDL